MTKISKKPLDPEKFGHYINNLWTAFTLMDSKEDIKSLFKDLFTHTEYKMFAKRLEIARRLIRQHKYDDIVRDLSVTANTISRVNNKLNETGIGLRKAHKKLEELEEKYLKKQKQYTDNLSNPFLQKVKNHQKTVLGQAVKAGILALDKTISKKIKQNTAKKYLPL